MDSEEETSFSVENQTNKHPVEDEPKKKKAKSPTLVRNISLKDKRSSIISSLINVS